MFISSHYINRLLFTVGLLFICSTSSAYAGGIALGATRVIYPMNAKQTSLAITNSDKSNRFLIQSWVEDSNEKKTNSFVLTPPLFVSKAKSENTLRIMYVGPQLPKDRESVFWLNSKAIPSIDRDSIKDKNVLQIAILSRIKIFIRPENLPSKPIDAPSTITINRQGDSIKINNPSPYYVSMVNLKVDGNNLPNTMVSPMGSALVKAPRITAGNVTFEAVNDYGANTPVINVQAK